MDNKKKRNIKRYLLLLYLSIKAIHDLFLFHFHPETTKKPTKKTKKSRKSAWRSVVIQAKKMTEKDILLQIAKAQTDPKPSPIRFQVKSKEEIEMCSPKHYCSEK